MAPPGLPVNLERLSVPPSAVEGPHEQQPQALPQRMVGDEPAEFRRGLGVAAAGKLRLAAELGGVEAELGQPFGLGFDQRRRRDVGQRPAVPQAERLGELAAARSGSPAANARLPSRSMASNSSASVSAEVTPELVAGGAGDQQAAVGVCP
jgi:hypothetical protein